MNAEKMLSQITRIADALENISGALDNIDQSLEELTECIGYVPPTPYQVEGIHFIRIGGSIDTM